MKTLNSVSQAIPITMLAMYLILFFYIDSLYYSSIYNTIVVKVDTALMALSIIGFALFYKNWTRLATVSFITVIVLNILTELDIRYTIEHYYDFYIGTFIIYGISLAVFYKK